MVHLMDIGVGRGWRVLGWEMRGELEGWGDGGMEGWRDGRMVRWRDGRKGGGIHAPLCCEQRLGVCQ